MLFKGIILTCGAKIQDNRTITATYYLLIGNRSIQTVQDAQLFGLNKFYGIYKNLDKNHFDKTISQLINENMLTANLQTPSSYKLTNQGNKWLKDNISHLPLTYFNGLNYHTLDQIFFDRLLLLIQVLTNSKMKYSTYIPVVDKTSITNWMVHFYLQVKSNIDHQLQYLYDELHDLLANFSKQEAGIFVDYLTGYKNYGMSIYQLSDRYQIDQDHVKLVLVGMVHNMLDTIMFNNSKFPLMKSIINDLSFTSFITDSASKTYNLIKNGYSTEKIAQTRHLKLNTVYDHIVEIALYDPTFTIDPYVNKRVQLEVMNFVKETKSTKLKEIKMSVSEDISYFQIRLTLVSAGNILE